MASTHTQPADPAAVAGASGDDGLPILGIDHIELYVGNARQAAWAYERLGFSVAGYAGLEHGQRDRASWYVCQGDIRFVLTGALGSDSAIAEHVRRHGDGVVDIAFRVPDATAAFQQALAAGAAPVAEPSRLRDEHGELTLCRIGAVGSIVHTLVERGDYGGRFLPGYQGVDGPPAEPVGVTGIDHVVLAVPTGHSDELVAFYRDVFGFHRLHHFDDDQIRTEHSALMNKVVADGTGRIKIPIVEPGRSIRRSQVQEFLDYHEGPGVQHVALSTPDIVGSVETLRERGVQFLYTPAAYYDRIEQAAEVAGRLDALRRNGILFDRDDEGHLLQIFAKSLHDRPTLFFELIERHGAVGFGEGNIRALYEALEREQAARGNL